MSPTRPYVQTKRAEARERTRSALLDAAEAAFFSERWEVVSLDAIAADAGVTKQTLLRHFGSKEGLLEEGLRRGMAAVASQRLSTPPGDIEAAIENVLDHYEEWGEQSLKIAGMEGGEAIAEVGRRARGLHYDWVEHAFGRVLDRMDDAVRSRVRAGLIVLCDVHAWQILSRDLGLARAEVHATLAVAIRRLLEEGS